MLPLRQRVLTAAVPLFGEGGQRQWHHLSKDYERKEESSEAFIHLGMTRLMLRRLA